MKRHLSIALSALISAEAAFAQTSPTASPVPTASHPPQEAFGPWGVDLSARDVSIKPGDDFVHYASGAWDKKTQIPADQPSAGVGFDVYNLSQDQLRTLIEGSVRISQIGGLYGSFVDEARVDSLGAKPLEADLAKIAAVANKEDFAKLMGHTHGGFGASFFDLTVEPDTKRPDLNVQWVYQSGLGLPDRDYYLTPTFKPQLDAYRAYVERTLSLIKYPDPAGAATAVVDLESKIAKVSWASAERRDIEKANNPMSLAELESYGSGFPWKSYLAAAGITSPRSDDCGGEQRDQSESHSCTRILLLRPCWPGKHSAPSMMHRLIWRSLLSIAASPLQRR